MPSKYKPRNTAYLRQPHSGKKAPPSQAELELNAVTLMATYSDDEKAREYLEKIRWPEGPVCPHCGQHEVTKLAGKATRPGVYKCKSKGCRKQFTVTVGTIFEASHIRLRHWVIAFHAMCASKKGVSAHQLHRMLDITYKSAWFMCHRIRHALDQGMETKLDGVLEADETWVGGKPRKVAGQPRQGIKGRGTPKAPVAVLVQRDGAAVCKPIKNASSKELRTVAQHAAPTATLMTDEWKPYGPIGKELAAHHRVNHGKGEYAKKLPDGTMVHSNTAESFFSLLKRGHMGVYHKMSKKHLFRYCNEFAFRWTNRKVSDAERTVKALEGVDGKRLTYR